MIEIGYAYKVYAIIHEVGCRTELPLSAWRDRRSTDILCTRVFRSVAGDSIEN
jgi:hypothetical protein